MNQYTKSHTLNFFIALVDAAIVLLSHLLVNHIISFTSYAQAGWITAFLHTAATIFLYHIYDFYAYVEDTKANNITSVMITSTILIVAKTFVCLFTGMKYFYPIYTIMMFVFASLLSIIWRVIVSAILNKNRRSVLIVDSVNVPSRLARKLKYSDNHNERTRYCLVDEKNPREVNYLLENLIPQYDVIFVSHHISPQLTKDISYKAMFLRKRMQKEAIAVNVAFYLGKLRNPTDTPIIELPLLGLNKRQRIVKRIFDLVVSLMLLVILSPIMLIIALLIKLDSPGPVFYQQERYTINKKIFNIYKFRTMVVDAEKNGAQYQTKNDPRITRVGNILRKTHLDEFPQLVNVIKGDMSFVGPRPERPIFADEYCEKVVDYELRYLEKAGITGYSHVYGYYSSRASDRIIMDLIYMANYSFYYDIKLMLMTVRQVFVHDGATGVDIELEESLNIPEKELERHRISFKELEEAEDETSISYYSVL
ncbi:MAG: sugar transferase [Oscillospiraceae bacterium]|nr:sugar transferase [Oscillospiraceae bacterium]